jgi:hypothetical protein
MRKIELQIDDDLWAWLQETADRERLSVEETITVLIGLESNLRNQTSDGRNYSPKATLHRSYDRLIAPPFPRKLEQETTN